jgi:hypothetical protein
MVILVLAFDPRPQAKFALLLAAEGETVAVMKVPVSFLSLTVTTGDQVLPPLVEISAMQDSPLSSDSPAAFIVTLTPV